MMRMPFAVSECSKDLVGESSCSRLRQTRCLGASCAADISARITDAYTLVVFAKSSSAIPSGSRKADKTSKVRHVIRHLVIEKPSRMIESPGTGAIISSSDAPALGHGGCFVFPVPVTRKNHPQESGTCE